MGVTADRAKHLTRLSDGSIEESDMTDDVDRRQSCKVCKRRDGFNFQVDNAVWKIVVDPEYRNLVVCLACFDQMAFAKGISYNDALWDSLYFTGRGETGFLFRLHRR